MASEDVRGMFDSADGIESAIGQALGAASVCWEYPERAGVFDSERCSAIVTELLRYVSWRLSDPRDQLPDASEYEPVDDPSMSMVPPMMMYPEDSEPLAEYVFEVHDGPDPCPSSAEAGDVEKPSMETLSRSGDSDAMKWAEAFAEFVQDHPEAATDVGYLVGVFANAIETARPRETI